MKNILFITSDQQRFDTIGKVNPLIKTPNLDKLCDDGILFTRGYTCNPVSTPTRISMLTGEYPSKHGCYTIGTGLPMDYNTVPKLLNDCGYFTSLIGKAHFQPCIGDDSFESDPNIHDMDFFKNWSGDFYGFKYAKLLICHGDELNAASMHYKLWLLEKGVKVEDYFGTHSYHSFGKWDLPDEYSSANWTFEETTKAIDLAAEEEKPFFIWSSFQNPHNPCYTPEPWASMYDDVELPDYSFVDGENDNRPDLYKNVRNLVNGQRKDTPIYGEEVYNGDKDWHCCTGHILGAETKEEKQLIMRQYYAMVSQMDHYIGKIIDYLKEQNIYDNTIIVFTSDHGDYMGNHGLWWKGLPAFEDIHNVPFIVAHPDCKTKGTISESLQSVIDIPATILDIAKAEIPNNIQGISQETTWIDNNTAIRKNCIIEFRPTESEFMQTTLVTQQYKLVTYSNRTYGELYDLSVDKNQYNNLWDNPDFTTVKMNLLLELISAEMDKDSFHLRTRTAAA